MLWKSPASRASNGRGGLRKNDSAPPRGGRYRSRPRRSLHSAQLPLDPLGPPESTARDCSLPHRCTRRASRPVPRCCYRTTSYNSCRDRHCPKCQSGARDKWIMARQNELLPVTYVHVVFTLPHQLSPLALQNKKVLYDLLFRASAETLLEVARDPRHLG